MIRTIRKRKEYYLNANDLVKVIREHRDFVTGRAPDVSDGYSLAHEHIIDIINVFAHVDSDS